MATVFKDLVQESGYQRSMDGQIYRRVCEISGLPRLSDSSDFHYNAYADLVSAYPELGFGQFHPKIPGLIIADVLVKPVLNSRNSAKVIVEYRDLGVVRIRTYGTTTSETTRFNSRGELLSVRFVRGKNNQHTPATGEGEIDYAHAPRLRPGQMVEFEIYQDAATVGTPYRQARQYQGKLNRSPWQGEPARTWKCLNITGEPLNHNIFVTSVWRYVYQFEFIGFEYATSEGQKIALTYDPMLIWLDKHTGRPPGGLNPIEGGWPTQREGNGWKQDQIDLDAEFNNLSALPLINYGGA